MKACKGSRDTAPVILDPDTGRTEWSTAFPDQSASGKERRHMPGGLQSRLDI